MASTSDDNILQAAENVADKFIKFRQLSGHVAYLEESLREVKEQMYKAERDLREARTEMDRTIVMEYGA